MFHRLLVLAFLSFAAASLVAQPNDDDDPDPKTIERLVRELGSGQYRQRELATLELRKIADLAIPYLRRQERSNDLEASRRARNLLTEIETDTHVLLGAGHTKGVITLAFLAGDQKVLSAGEDNNICLWSLTSRRLLRRLEGHTKQVWALAVAPDGKSFASGGQEGVIRVWNIEGEPKSRVLATVPDCVRCLVYSADGQRLFVGTFDKNIYVIDVKAGRTAATWDGHQDAVHCLALSPDGTKLLSGGGFRDATVCLRDARTGAIRKRLVGHHDHVFAVAFVDNDHAVSAGYDNIIRLWDLKAGKIQREFKDHERGVYGLAVSRDGQRLLSGALDSVVRLWDLHTGDELLRFTQHEEGINALVLAANGRFAVSAGGDHTVRLWKLPRVAKKK